MHIKKQLKMGYFKNKEVTHLFLNIYSKLLYNLNKIK